MSLLHSPFTNPARPVIVFQFVNECSPYHIHEMFARTLEFMDAMNTHHIYRVVDSTHLKGTPAEIRQLIETSFEYVPGSSTFDLRVTPIGSGPKYIADLYHEVLKSNPVCRRHSVPFFPTLHAALDFIRQL
jgi:hypothetical protein